MEAESIFFYLMSGIILFMGVGGYFTDYKCRKNPIYPNMTHWVMGMIMTMTIILLVVSLASWSEEHPTIDFTDT